MDPRVEQANLEARGWAAFEDALSRVPDERLTAPGVLDGWTVKEMLHHVTGWLGVCIDDLEQMRAGSFVDRDETDAEVDARNASFAEKARGLEVAVVRSALEDARERILRAWRDLPEIDAVAIERFSVETYEHYAEHLPDLRRAAEDDPA